MLSTGCNEIIRGCFHEPQSKLLPDKPGSHVRCLCPFITHHTKNSLVLGLFVHVCVCSGRLSYVFNIQEQSDHEDYTLNVSEQLTEPL